MTAAHSDWFLNVAMLLALVAGLGLWWLTQRVGTRGRIALRIRGAGIGQRTIATEIQDELEATGWRRRWLLKMAAVGDKMPLFDMSYRQKLQKEMIRSGYRSKFSVSILLAVKFASGLIFAALAVTFGSHIPVIGSFPMGRGIAMLGAFVIGMIVPEYVVSFQANRRRKIMGASLPDALDLLVICTNAGNSFLVSLRRVADEMKTICPPLANEFSLTADELTLSGDTQRSLQSLGERIDLSSIRALISTLTQSMRYGTPITQSLRTLSRTERLANINSLEEKAAKLAPKMVVPMLLFVLPPVVVIAAGPAVIQLMDMINK